MKKRNILISLLILEFAVVSVPFIGSANADSGFTAVTFVINPYSGGLAITVPSAITFGAMTSPENTDSVTVTSTIVVVTDTRRGTNITWSTTAGATTLLSGGESITATMLSYKPGIMAKTGTVVTTEHNQASLVSAVAVASSAGIYGNNIVSWTPTLTLTVPANQPAGLYSGTITHSVA